MDKRCLPKNQQLQKFIKRTLQLGAKKAKIISPSEVETAAWVRLKCQFGCDGYGTSLMCPPYTPRPEETRQVLDGYKKGILFQSDSRNTKEIAVQIEKDFSLAGFYKALGLGGGPCRLCRNCAFTKGCRHAEEARPAMEACGIDVFTTARRHNLAIRVLKNYQELPHYFGLVLIA